MTITHCKNLKLSLSLKKYTLLWMLIMKLNLISANTLDHYEQKEKMDSSQHEVFLKYLSSFK